MKTTKKAISIVLAGLMTAGSMSALSVSAVEETSPTLSFKTQNALYAHAVSGSADSLMRGLPGSVSITSI